MTSWRNGAWSIPAFGLGGTDLPSSWLCVPREHVRVSDRAADLPRFRYHPDPLATGSVDVSDAPCGACGEVRGYLYSGPVYGEGEGPALCPWCIADGSAARRFGAEFTDVGWGVPDDVPRAVIDEISHRTPGFSAWQQDHWMYHCADGCAFVGPVAGDDLERYPGALESLTQGDDGESERAYLFCCLGCGTYLAFGDAD